MKITKNIKLIAALITFSGIVVSSCVYDESDQIAGKGVSIIRMEVGPGEYGINFSVAAFDAVVGAGPIITINRDAVSNSDLNTTATVDFALDFKSLEPLNDSIMNAQIAESLADDDPDNDLVAGVDDFDTLYALPPDTYSFSGEGVSGGKITFAPGEAVKELQIDLDPTTLSFTTNYALPVRLSNASGDYKVSNATGFAAIQVIVKNAFDGVYHAVGTRYNFNAAGDYTGDWPPTGYVSTGPWDFDADIITAGPSTCTVHAGNSNGGFGTINITIESDNTVTIEPNGTTGLNALVPLPGYTSTYDPDTRRFKLYYQYTNTTGTFRVLGEVLDYKRSR